MRIRLQTKAIFYPKVSINLRITNFVLLVLGFWTAKEKNDTQEDKSIRQAVELVFGELFTQLRTFYEPFKR